MIYEIHLWGLYVTEFLQTRLQACDNIFTLLSVVTDPSILYTVYFPIAYAVVPEVGLKLLHAAAAGEWINLFLKWVFLGDRPYWWVNENALDTSIRIKQFYNTCETGPGTPSGHITIASMAFYVLASATAKKLGELNRLHIKRVWIIYGIIMFLLGISRAFIAAHFIHQCILGLISGLPFGKIINEMKLQYFKWHHYVIITVSFLGSILALELLLMAMGVDVTWTMQLAQKWCMKKSWVHVATTPYYVMWRFSGATLGLGLVRRSLDFEKFLQVKSTAKDKFFLVIAGLVISYILIGLIPKSNNHTILYMSIFVAYMFNTYCIAILLPRLANAITVFLGKQDD